MTTAEIVEVSRDELAYVSAGRRLRILVEWGTTLIVHGTDGRWDDGTPLSDDELRTAQAALEHRIVDAARSECPSCRVAATMPFMITKRRGDGRW